MRLRRWIGLAAVVVAVATTACEGSSASTPTARFLVETFQSSNGHVRLTLVDANGRVSRVISKNVPFSGVALSPDERLVTYGSKNGLKIEGIDGSGRRLLAPFRVPCRGHEVCVANVVWSPDSTRLLVTDWELHHGEFRTFLRLVSVATGRSHRLVGPTYQRRYGALAWSGPADKIAYISAHPTYDPSLVVSDPNSRSRKTICSNCGTPADDPSVAWSPDGQWIAYTPGDSASVDIYDVASGATTSVEHVYGALWAPDSSEFATHTNKGQVAFFSPAGTELSASNLRSASFLAWTSAGMYYAIGSTIYLLPTGQTTAQSVFSVPRGQGLLWAQPLQ